ncbi:putative tetratricopeptide repeat protein 41 isoform X3 [Dendropsophus ebraccatus]|uniref:putative tetratricopeptide repeat protein 41 isoform X3 n=1 Tax=Dendropsophus ebraccatus TaxID=150705 RepID=UPI0038322B54
MANYTIDKDHQNYFTSRSVIRPYVCSTPKDFVEERHYLAETVFPQLDDLCFTRGTSFKPVDLKWQIEKISSNVDFKSHVHHHITHKHLKLSLDYINSSCPYFICILGHTYGECVLENRIQASPGSADLSDDDGPSEVEKNLLVAANGGHPWILEGTNKTRSFTELEVIQALLLKDTRSQYFYFRDYQYVEDRLQQANTNDKWTILSTFTSENEVEELRIWELKTSIVDQGLPVRFFTTKEELGALVLKDWCDVIEKLYPLSNTPVHIGIQMDDFYSNENINDLWEFSLLEEVFLASVALKPCVLVLDGVDGLSGIHGVNAQQAKGFEWLPARLPHQCKMIMTTRSSHLSYKSLISRSDVQIEELQMTSDTEERLCIFRKHLAMPSRKVPPCLMESLENKKRKISPLQLGVLASELRTCPDVANCIDSPLETLSTEQLWSLLIKHWVKHYSWPREWKQKSKTPKSAFGSDIHNSGWVVDVLCLLATSHCGLHEDDILKFLKKIGYKDQYEVTSLHWAAFRLATLKWIWEKPDGLLQFHHQSFHDAVVHLLFGDATPVVESLNYTSQNTVNRKRKHFHRLHLKYFQQIEFSRLAFDEVPWHLKMIGKLHELYRFLLNQRTLDLIRRNMKHGYQMKMDLIHYWQILLYSGKEPAVECQSLLHNITEDTADLTAQCRVILFAVQCLIDIGKTKEAGAILSSIEHHLESSGSRNNEVLMWTQKISGDLYKDIGSWQEAISYYEKALDNLQCLTENDLQENYKLLSLRGRLLCFKATLEAKLCYEQKRNILENPIERLHSYTTGPYEQAAMKLWQGLYKFSISDISESEKYLVDCLAIRCKLYGKNHFLCGEVQEYIADIQVHLGSSHYSQRQQAIESYKNVIKIQEETEKRCPSPEIRQYLKLRLSNTLVKSGKLLSCDNLGNKKKSVEMLQRSLDLRTSIVGTEHPLTYEVQLYLKELNCRPPWSSKVPALLEDDKWLPAKSEVSQRKSYSAQPRRHHLCSEYGRTSPEVLHISAEGRSDNFPLRYNSRRELMTRSPLIRNYNLKSDQEVESLCEQMNHSPAFHMFTSKSLAKRPVSVTSCWIHSLCSRPESACQTSLSGPHSDLVSLVSITRPSSKCEHYKLVHKSAWYHAPGRYPTLQTPFPPKRHQLRKDI